MAHVGIIGCGSMGTAMLSGMLASGWLTPEEIVVFHRRRAQGEELKERYGMVLANSCLDLLHQVDIVILGVKPKDYPALIDQIKGELKEHQVVVSIAAGIALETLEEMFGEARKIVRVMPNTPAMVQAAMSAIVPNQWISEMDLQRIQQMCASFGSYQVIEERLIDAVIAVSGSAPAYVYLFLEALADGAVREGMPRKMAYEFAAQSVLGAAKMMQVTQEHPGRLKDAVCSPGGTTIEAVIALERYGFRNAVLQAMDACAQKSRSMGQLPKK